MLRRVSILACCLCLPTLALAANQGILHGSVRDELGQPLARVHVLLLARGERKVDDHLTDAQGHFEFEQIPFGEYRLSFAAPDGRMDLRDVRLASGDVTLVDVVLPRLEEDVVVRPPPPQAPPPPTVSSSSSTLMHEDIQALPRGDTASVNEILATQPGFVYDAFGNLFVRGNHANIQYQLDGVPLPDSVSGLFGGFLSPKLIENMEVISGGLNAEYGERLAGVVNLNSRKTDTDGEGQAELVYGAYQTLNPSAFYSRRIGNLSLLVGGSFKRTDRSLDPPVFAPILHDRGDEERGFLKLDEEFSDRDHLSLLTSFSRNRYQIPLDPTATVFDPSSPNGGRTPDVYGNAAPAYVPLNTDARQTEHDLFGLLSYRHDFGASSSLRTSAYYRHSDGIFTGDAEHALGPGADPCMSDSAGNTSCSTASDVTRIGNHLGFDGDYLLRIGERHVVKVGAKLDQLTGRTAYTAYTRSDALQAPDPVQTLSGSDHATATRGGAFAQDRVDLGKLVLNGGVRFDFQKVAFQGAPDPALQTGLGPRVGAAYAWSKNLVTHAFAGLLWQPPPVLDTPAAARQLGVVPADAPVPYDLRAEKDRYAEVGVSARVLPQLNLTLNAWGKLSTDQLDDVQVGNTNVLTPYNFRDGRAAGIEGSASVVLSQDFNAFVNASVERAEGRGIATATYLFPAEALANAQWQTLDHVQTFTSNAGFSFHDGPTQVSALFNYGSGLRTGPANNQHVPGHVQIDTTFAHEFRALPGKPSLSIDLVNLLDNPYAYRLANGFNGSHYAPGRSAYLRLTTAF